MRTKLVMLNHTHGNKQEHITEHKTQHKTQPNMKKNHDADDGTKKERWAKFNWIVFEWNEIADFKLLHSKTSHTRCRFKYQLSKRPNSEITHKPEPKPHRCRMILGFLCTKVSFLDNAIFSVLFSLSLFLYFFIRRFVLFCYFCLFSESWLECSLESFVVL